MNPMPEVRFAELAMKVLAGQSTNAERAELDAMLASDPALRLDYRRLEAEVSLAKELVPLAEATTATKGELPAYARGRLQTKVRQTLGRPASAPVRSEGAAVGMLFRWRWWVGVALAATVAALLAIPPFLGSRTPVIEVAMLDLAGATRGAGTQATTLLTGTWPGAAVQQLASDAELQAWETNWPIKSRRLVVKVVYDQSTGELRVVGHGPASSFTNTFPVDSDLRAMLVKAKAYLDSQIPK